MRQITIELDDRLAGEAERLAAARGTTVAALIEGFLHREAALPDGMGPRGAAETEAAYLARAAMVRLAREAPVTAIPYEWNRQDAYADRLPGHERRAVRGDGSVE